MRVTSPTPTTYDAIKNLQSSLIRKALAGSVFVADVSAAAPTSLTTGAASGLAPLPEGYEDLGYITKDDGLSWSRSTEVSEVTSWGSVEPTRRDINSDVTNLAFTAQETKRATLGLYYNLDLSTVTPDATTGEVAFAQPTRPATKYMRVFALFVDGVGADTIYVARFLPRAMLSEVDDQAWTDGDDPVGYPCTLAATPDEDLGYSVRHFFGGPGWKSRLEDMGFAAA